MPVIPANLLRCPVCSGPLEATGASTALACASGHRFDAAKQGYFNLLTGRGTEFRPDTAAMVEARSAFLGAGHYGALRNAIADGAQRHVPTPTLILDAGAGTGYYLEELHRRYPGVQSVALDISKYALRRAAKAVDDGVSLVWDVWRPLPLRSSSLDLMINVFAPRNPAEFHRVLTSGGVLLVVTPRPGHLAGIASAASLLGVPPGKAADVRSSLDGLFRQVDTVSVESTLRLSRTDVYHAALMGPAGHHLDRAALLARTALLPELSAVSACFTLQVFRSEP